MRRMAFIFNYYYFLSFFAKKSSNPALPRRHASITVLTPALRTAGNIVTGDDSQTQTMINCGILPCLLTLLGHPKVCRLFRRRAPPF